MNFLTKKKKSLILISAIVAVLSFSNYLFAYDEIIVHPSLTEEMAKLYNKNFNDNELSDEEIKWLKQGSIDEDKNIVLAARSSNHFYNPFGVKKWADNTAQANIVSEPKLTAKEWAHDSQGQATSPDGDFTWERAIRDYASGDKRRAYESLGHILHLLEDMAVPAHTRNDLHVSFAILGYDKGEREPYEDWTRDQARAGSLDFNLADKLFQENKKPISQSNLDGYFDEMAIFTNTKFFSKDTIYTYSEPNNLIEGKEKLSNGDIVNYVYGIDNNGNKNKLASISFDDPKNPKIYTLTNLNESVEASIYSDYWSHLAPKSVLIGAGAIKLFKDEAEKSAKNPQTANQSRLTKYSYDFYGWTMKNGGTIVKNEITLGGLLGNGAVYAAIQTTQIVKNSAIALYDWEKAQAAIAYNTVKIITVAVFNKTKTGLESAGKYALVSVQSAAGKAGDFFNSGVDSVSRYFTIAAKAQLEFDISNPLPQGMHSIEDIIRQVKAAENIQPLPVVASPIYGAKLEALPNQKIFFAPGEKIALAAEIKNTGNAAWQGDKISLNIYSAESADFYHFSWLTKVRPASLGKVIIFPEGLGVFNFIAMAPLESGDYYFRVRPVRQNETGEFSWLGQGIAAWNISVRAPETKIEKEKPEEIFEAEKAEETVLAADDILPPDETIPVADENDEKEKSEKEAPAAAEAARLEEEAAKLKEKEAARLKEEDSAMAQEEEDRILKRKRYRSLSASLPETGIVSAPENPTFETAAVFRFSSTKADSIFYCSLDGGDFTPCGEYSIFENLAVGAHSLKVKAGNAQGNFDETPEYREWMIEAPPPAGPHLVISEIQIGGVLDVDDEFIEIYNPSDLAANLDGWSIQYRGGGATDYYKKNFSAGAKIPSHGYFLIARKDKYTGAVFPDMTWGASLSGNGGTVFLANSGEYLTAETDGGPLVVDKIAYGEAGERGRLSPENIEFNPAPFGDQSLERKAGAGSTGETLAGGADKYLGNGRDTDDNSVDFTAQAAPNPQNSKSFPEPKYEPDNIADFRAEGIAGNAGGTILKWSAAYGAFGNPDNLIYDIRYSSAEIGDDSDFNSAISVSSLSDDDFSVVIPKVKSAGQSQELTIDRLPRDSTEYYFAVKTMDIASGLESGISATFFAIPIMEL